MTKLTVHILNFHGITNSHLEILLKYTPTDPSERPCYYLMNRWSTLEPDDNWFYWDCDDPKISGQGYIDSASSVYSFEIDADPDQISREWNLYWHLTKKRAWFFYNNCADATQWFLSKFAQIPAPNLSNVSWNHLSFGLIWPSFLPFPVALPGRIMSNAKFHIEAREAAKNPEKAKSYQYNRLLLYTSMSLATLTFTASIFALALAATLLTGGIAIAAIGGCAVIGLASTYCFFKTRNILSAQNLITEHQSKALIDP